MCAPILFNPTVRLLSQNLLKHTVALLLLTLMKSYTIKSYKSTKFVTPNSSSLCILLDFKH